MTTSSDGTTTVTRGPRITLATGTAQSMTASSPQGTERHLLLELNDEPITPAQARALAAHLIRFSEDEP
ncbi:hypothetical protein ACTXI9_01605 [Brachybacterium alimentarium]|uniref:hypothetical protein n=1 Tax=Brachybacterium alimentarium TaxID=47845 RepID=UPI003FD55F8C